MKVERVKMKILKIFTKNPQNIFYFVDFSGNAHEFLIICTQTSKYLNIYYQKRPKNLFSITGMERKYF